MATLSAITTTPDLLSLIGPDTKLQRVARDEYAGPCPKCGGDDRLHINLARGIWQCRRCHKWTDAAGYVMWRDEVNYPEAKRRLGDVPMIAPPPPPPELTDARRETFGLIAADCHAAMSDKPRAWLANRGIEDAMIDRFKLGYCPGTSGQSEAMHGLRVPCGITIPLHGVDGLLYGVQVRRAGRPSFWTVPKDWRYHLVAGSRAPLYGLHPRHDVCVLVEGSFDCVLLQRLVGNLVDVAATGTCKGSVEDRWFGYLVRHRRWLVAYDADEAGDKGAASWLANYGARTVRARVESGSDPSDWWQVIAAQRGTAAADGALRRWVEGMVV